MQVWLDVDTGIDDAIALLIAAARLPGDRLAWVSTVAGNVSLDRVVENTRRVLAAAGREDVAVWAGADRPLVRPPVDAAYVHGSTGLGAVELSPGGRPVAGDLVALLERMREVPDRSLILCATAPLTNVALMARVAPDLLRRKVARVVWMGGGRGVGNVTVAAEFNAYADPEAAAIVLEHMAPVTVVDLGTTRGAYLTGEEVAALDRAGGSRARLARRLLSDPAYVGGMSMPDRVVVHDAVALLEALEPGALFSTERSRIAVDLSRGLAYGATWVGPSVDGPEVDWSTVPDRARFVAALTEALQAP